MSSKESKKLGVLASTAISGNDISSSVLYVSALAIAFAGKFAWVTLLIVALVLYLYRKIYAEVIGAIPMNGGAYNALLNTTSKSLASFAATLTILSYMATAVISANEAIHYLHYLLPVIPIIIATIVLLSVFAILTISGIKESSIVAIIIFIFHLVSLVVLSSFIIYYLLNHGLSQFFENQNSTFTEGNIGTAIFLGFAASMLGVSGFESSANFVEEQKVGVFPKTLKNMWIIVSIFNPLMAILALSLFALPVLQSDSYQNTLLIEMANIAGGNWLASFIAIDAFLVLSGAVLTSFVGVTGLLERITLDRIFPNFFLKKNKRGSSHRIIILFLILSISILLITQGNVKLIAGVYSISFLTVMALFALGNIYLKVKRKSLPRPVKAPWISVFIALIAVIIAIYGNLIMEPKDDLPSNLTVFFSYFIPFIIFIFIMLNRILILKIILSIVKHFFNKIQKSVYGINHSIINLINKISSQEFVFFTKGDNIASLNKVMIYITNNEHTKKVKIVKVLEKEEVISEKFEMEIDVLDRQYPEIEVEYTIEKGVFGPELIKELSKKWNIPINFMFMGSPSEKFKYRIEELGGVRLII
jgi:amino acid transporter